MTYGRLLLVLLMLLIIRAGRAQESLWSGLVNVEGQNVDFLCPDDLALSGIASDFVTNDRQWEFQCTSAGGLANVSLSCQLQSVVNTLQSDLNFDCPDNGYLAGLASEYSSSSTDREWQPYCCSRPFAALINCREPASSWENVLRSNLNFSAPAVGSQVIAGLESFYFNRDRRWRFRTCDVQVDCGDPGVPDNSDRVGDSFLYNSTVTFTCNHGYYQSSGPLGGVRRCLESGLWSDEQPVCSACTPIADCVDIRCTNSTDQFCEECASDNGMGLGESAFTNNHTQCLPKCSWLTTFCYPGNCPGLPSSCNCSDGFEGADCLQISESPALTGCAVTVVGKDGDEDILSCQPNSTTPLIYTNIVPYRLEGEWGVVYIVPTPLPPRPAYVAKFSVGVAISQIQATLFRAANPSIPVSMTTHPCGNTSVSLDMPISGMVQCSLDATSTNLSAHTFLHGDMLEVQAVTSAGGYLDVLNLDLTQTQRHYYNATPTIGTTVFVLDLQPPTHCSLSNTCSPNQNILSLSGDIVTSNQTSVSWGGWVDTPSGVTGYQLDVYHLVYEGGLLTEGDRLTGNATTHTGQSSYTDTVYLPGEGPYSFVLQSHDLAGNTRFSRRALLYDFNSSIEIDPASPLTVDSAHPSMGHLWQNSTDRSILISGVGHFYNTNLRRVNLLAPLANYTTAGIVEPGFDQPTRGRFPRVGTPNDLGIVELSYAITTDHMGGNSSTSLTPPTEFPFRTSDLGIESVNISTPVADGDSVRVWFRAQDFRSQFIVDDVLVHIDSSSPVLIDLALNWNGVGGLSLHGTGTLLDLDVRFQAYDEHSGVFGVEWSISTVTNPQPVGSGRVLVTMEEPASCHAPQCVCDPLNHCTPRDFAIRPPASDLVDLQAIHDTEYRVTVIVTNHALLTSTLSHVFTVDATPPLQGHVIDGRESHDIDYQTHLELSARWLGFFDRESDILTYQYQFGPQCTTPDQFTYPLNTSTPSVQTTATMATWTAPSNGTYFVTVVAFNQALQPSPPLCSDGVTIDTVAPEISGVVIPGAVVRPGLVSDESGGVWFVRRDRVRVWIGACPNVTVPQADLRAYPIGFDGVPVDVCTTSTTFTPSQLTHLTADSTLNVTWSAFDNVGVVTHEVGVVTATNFTSDGRHIQYHHTAGQAHYSFSDSELLSNGNRFYLSVRVTDFAQQPTVVHVGPILVDVTPPSFNGTLEAVQNSGHVTITWAEDWFVDLESGVSGYQFAVGGTELGTQLSGFEPIPPAMPPQCPTPFCLVIDTAMFSLLSGRKYYITIKVTNQAGLSTHVSTPFTHLSQPPTPGFVSDLDPQVTFDLSNRYNSYESDIDLLIDSALLGVRWGGFVHPNLPTNYSIGLGTAPGLDDTAPMVAVGMATEYVFSNVTLVSDVVYYSTVTAENSVGRVNVSSNGVLVLMGVADSLSSAHVIDGPSPVDIDYQVSRTAVSASWVFPPLVHTHLSWYEWAVLTNGSPLTPYSPVGRDTSVQVGVAALKEGVVYVSAVRACFPDRCLDPVLSDGFQVLSPPQSSSIQAVYTPLELDSVYGMSGYGSVDLVWEPFQGPQITRYEWSIGNGDTGTELLVPWTQSEGLSVYGSEINASLSLHKPNYVSVRGYNSAGLYSMSMTSLEWNVDGETLPQSQVPRSPLAVYDIPDSEVPPLFTDNWKDIEHVQRSYTDIDYTNSAHSLSAVWPRLRYTAYTYSLSTRRQFTTCEGDPYSVACGSTIGSGVTVTNLDLVDGERYYFCVHGVIADAIHATPTTPPTLTHCSNGITVDLTPPISGCVQVITLSVNESDHMTGSGLSSGYGPVPDNTECAGNGTGFVVSRSELVVVWEEFRDVEESGDAVHVTGVRDYQIAIGTSPGGNDVIDFTSVGVVTYAVVRGLSLESGLTYHVTIRGTDLVGHVTNAFSQPVTVDTTPPPTVRVWIEGGSSYPDTGLTLAWGRPTDVESGVGGLEWALGSRPGSSDIVDWRQVGVAQTSERIDGGPFRDCQTLFLSVQVTNGAGLISVSSSRAHLLDHTPPSPGLVYDGPNIAGEVSDLDYTSDLSMLSSHWRAFSDPHSTVVEYFVAMGTEPGGTDVQDTISVGMATEVTLNELTLTHGHTHYTTITACNALGLCTSASSNGITADVTPPTSGRVLNGLTGSDVQIQASRTTLSARWTGFHDDESLIQYFTYQIGLSASDTSITTPTKLPPTQTSLTIPAPTTLPTDVTVYMTISAINGAGVRVQFTSSGVYIDGTPPSIITHVTLDTEWAGSVDMETQYSTTTARAQWNIMDSLTSVNSHYWSLLSRSNTRNPVPGQAIGSQSHTTATDLDIQDGDVHSALLIGCDQAGLCVQSISGPVLFDSSPPIDGYFAVATETRAVLNRTVPGGLTWRNRNLRGFATLNMAVLGFSDPHSGVTQYWVAVGTRFGSTDLMPSSGPEQVNGSLASEERGVSMLVIQLSRVLVEGELIHMSVWAVNGAGLKSHTVHGTFTVNPQTTVNNNGTLTLHRPAPCHMTSPDPLCTCGARGQPCQNNGSRSSNELDPLTQPPQRQVVIRAVSPQLTPGANSSRLYTAVTDKLVAEWELVDPSSDEFQYLEWSVSEVGGSPGDSVMRVLGGSVWAGVDNRTRLVFSSAQPLKHGVAYVFYLRAWFSNSSYTVFRSNSITVDMVGTETVLGERVRVSERFTSNPHTLTLSHKGVFSDTLSGALSTYTIAIGDSVHATNILNHSPLTFTLTPLMNLDLQDGRTYYITVQAESPLGVVTTSLSHPLTVDLTPPTTGHMFTGHMSRDVLAQTNSTSYTARWLGFTNPLSGVHHYELAVTSSLATPTPSEYTDVGISLRRTLDSLSLSDGGRYHPHLVAVSATGVRSRDFVLRRGVIIDTTPPVGVSSDGPEGNLVSNPSFEGVVSPLCSQSVHADQTTRNWTVGGASDIVTPYTQYDIIPYDGCHALLFSGSLSQSVHTQSGWWYRLSLTAHAYTHSRLTLSLPGASTVCRLAETGWTSCELVFQAQDSPSIVELTTPPNGGVVVDAVSVVGLVEYSQARNGTGTGGPSPNVIRTGIERVIGQSSVRIHAHWLIADPESGIRAFHWAVGTVPGGQQKQLYRSTGTQVSGVSGRVALRHNERVFVSVVAENFAGLSRTFHSMPILVDLTPPTSNGSVRDGDSSDRDYQCEGVVWADWTDVIVDEESELVSCLWGIGSSPGFTDLQLYMPVPRGVTRSHSNISRLLSHGTTVYSTVTCMTAAGHHGSAHSNGVTILTTPPSSSLAYSIITSPETIQYDIIPNYLPSNRLTLTWGGFAESAGTPLEYEVRVTNVTGGVGEWMNVGFLRQLTLNDVELPGNDSSHVIEVRAMNLAGITSDTLSREFYILTTPPLDSDMRVNDTWLSRDQLLLDWTDKFSSDGPLRYELSVGYQRGSGSIVKWVEFSSEQTSLTLTHPRLERSRDYYLTLTAIGPSSLHTSYNQVIPAIPMVT